MMWATSVATVDAVTRADLVRCWKEVSNAGGAVGLHPIPVTDEQVRREVDTMLVSLDPAVNRLLLARRCGVLAGWLLLAGNTIGLTAHWARVLRVQTTLAHRGTGAGRALMAEVARAARDDFSLDQLHLEVRGGMALERFYETCGWREIGRWPAALRVHGNDRRDEILMILSLR